MRVLVSIDGSPCSKRAVEFVAERAWRKDDEFIVFGVVEPIPHNLGFADHDREVEEHDGIMAAKHAEFSSVTDDGKEVIASTLPDNKVEAKVIEGVTVDEIVKFAKEWNADLIVVGSHGRTGLERLLMGSVAERVLKEAPCSVEVVKMKAHA